jgi:hypothetical protein
MAMKKTLTSARYPYIPLTVVVNKRSETIEALLDTGFDQGDRIMIPLNLRR